MSLDQAVYLIAALTLLLTISHGQAQFWKGKNENIETMHDNLVEANDILKSEVKFLRCQVNQSAAEYVDEHTF